MSDRMREGMARLASRLEGRASSVVTYSRGAHSVACSATIGRTRMLLSDGLGGSRVEHSDRDYLIQSAALILDGSAVEPEPGDLVTDADGVIYEVLAYGGTEPAYLPSDVYGIVYRIHTKKIS